ncbi:MAG: helix-turn-helix domain-containing protein [Planctomycetota bacterium]
MTPHTSAPNPQAAVRRGRGQALKRARKAAGLTAQDLAQRVNDLTVGSDITHHAIYSYERGKVLLSREVGHRVAEALSIHPGQLLLGDPDYRPAPAPGSSLTHYGGDEGGVDSPGATFGLPTEWMFELAQPLEQIDVAAYPGIDLRRRIEFLNAAAKLPAAGYVLGRLLETARLGRVEIEGYLDVFYLVIADLEAALNSDAARAVADFGAEEGNEELWKLLELLTRFKTLTDESFAKLVDPAGQTPSAIFETCKAYREALPETMTAIKGHLRRANRGLPIVGLGG